MRRIVVVGAGLAGARTCQELRRQGYDGELTLLGAEPHPPYDRPPLSKALLRGDVDDTTLEVDLDADVRLASPVTSVRPGVVTTVDGEVGWDGLVVATGAAPIGLPGEGARTLRTVDDARALRDALRPGARIVIVGAGWIGAEVATTAAARGCHVTVIEASGHPIAAAPGAIGRHTIPWYADAGVELLLGAKVSRADHDAVTMADNHRLDADLVLVAVGVRPRLDWLADSGVEVGVGVRTDASLRASLPRVVAVGDCLERYSPRLGRHVRLEHWDDALRAPTVAATTLLGGDAIYDPVPYVWSEQFGRYVQWVGWASGPPTVWRGSPDEAAWAAAWLDETGALIGFLGVDRQRDAVQARKAIAAGLRPDPARLADPHVQVRAT